MQKTPPGMNRRRLVEAAAATAAVSTLGLPSLVLAEESSSMSAVAQPKGSEKTAIHPFHVNVPEAKQTELRKRISATRWPERETHGRIARLQLATIQELACYWAADHYADPRRCS
jgi:hypothetical protein